MQNAKLRIHAYTATADGPAVYTTSNSWAENTLNWNTRPLRTSAATDDKGAIAANTWVEYNVTPFVTGNGTYSFTIAQTSSDGVDFRAREYTANRPELVLTTGLRQPEAHASGQPDCHRRHRLRSRSPGRPRRTTSASRATASSAAPRRSPAWAHRRRPTPTRASRRARTATRCAPIDAAQNLSDPSNTASATVPDTTKPTAPGNLQATAGTGQVALHLAGLDRQRGRDRLPGVPRHDAGREPRRTAHLLHGHRPGAGPYSYTVRAIDAAQNLSDPSNTASATVPDTTKPTAPGNLTATAGTGSGRAHAGRPRPTTWASPATGCTAAPRRSRASARRPPPTRTRASRPGPTATRCARSTPPRTSPTRATRRAPRCPTRPSRRAPGNLSAPPAPARSHSPGRPRRTTWASPATGCSAAPRRSRAWAHRRPPTRTPASAAGPYSYTVRAIDAAQNLSDPSNTASATVPDTTKPTAPGNLRATAGAGEVALALAGVNRQRRGHRVPGLPGRQSGRDGRRHGDHLHGHRPCSGPVHLHGQGGGRRPERLGSEQRGRPPRCPTRPSPRRRPTCGRSPAAPSRSI